MIDRRRFNTAAMASLGGLAGAGALSGCAGTAPGGAAQAPAEADADASRRFAELARRLVMQALERSPEASIQAGRYDDAARVTIPDAARRRDDDAFSAQALAELQAFDPARLAPPQRIEHALLRNRHESLRWSQQTFREWAWNPARHNVAPPLSNLLNTPYAPLEQRLAAISSRLARTADFYQAARDGLHDPTPEHLELALTQSRGALSLLGPTLSQHAAGSALSGADRALLEQRQAAARTAIEGWMAFLQEQQRRVAASGRARSFRIGAALYEPKFGFDIQAGFPAAELHRRAVAEKQRLHEEMDERTRQLWRGVFGREPQPADRLERIGRMIDRLSQRHVAREQFVPEIRRQIPLLAAFVRERDLLEQDESRPLAVRETPPWMRGGGAIASVSAPGPFNPTAETFYNVTPLTDFSDAQAASLLREYNHWVLQILNIHEAIPGHYTQLLHANKSASLVKSLVRNGAMVEGWAVYAERMMLEQGWGGQAPEMWLMYGKWNLRVVTNAILDHEVHVRGMGEADAMALLRREAFQEEAEARNKWRRVRLSQVQLGSYYAGYAAILDLRQRQRRALGARFSLKDFHNRLLSHGSAPVPDIAALMGTPA